MTVSNIVIQNIRNINDKPDVNLKDIKIKDLYSLREAIIFFSLKRILSEKFGKSDFVIYVFYDHPGFTAANKEAPYVEILGETDYSFSEPIDPNYNGNIDLFIVNKEWQDYNPKTMFNSLSKIENSKIVLKQNLIKGNYELDIDEDLFKRTEFNKISNKEEFKELNKVLLDIQSQLITQKIGDKIIIFRKNISDKFLEKENVFKNKFLTGITFDASIAERSGKRWFQIVNISDNAKTSNNIKKLECAKKWIEDEFISKQELINKIKKVSAIIFNEMSNEMPKLDEDSLKPIVDEVYKLLIN
ncbi:MAG: hypothetical protein WC307_03565 [Candidatus Nanoarchaeia archaeon]|jgi:hypothetical protein